MSVVFVRTFTRLPDIRLACAEEELRWRESIASQHLAALPARFTPRPQQDVMPPPGHPRMPVPQQRPAWEIGTAPSLPMPSAASQGSGARPSAAGAVPDGGTAGSRPGVRSRPGPAPALVMGFAPAAGQGGARTGAETGRTHPRGVWRRLLCWWRGH